MALNANAPYTGAVQYFMQFDAPSTYTAPGVVVGGSYAVDGRLRTADGIAGQRVTRGGIVGAAVEVELEEPVKALLADMLRAAPATKVAAKTFVFGNQDGEWTYTDCQPAGFTATCEVDKSFRAKVGFVAKTPDQTETGDTQEAVTGGITDNWSDFDVLVDGTDYGCQRFELRLKTNPYLFSTLDARTEGARRLPVEVLLGAQQVELTLDCANQIPAASSSVIADAIDTDIEAVIAGTGVTFALSGLATPEELGSFRNESGLVIWRYKFTDSAWDSLAIT
ncbi:MAG: hypothetical protein FJX75_29850 [Armatimonadetes bacterium]|nr:hypothetical protein [Armatimonadota bacterium]